MYQHTFSDRPTKRRELLGTDGKTSFESFDENNSPLFRKKCLNAYDEK